MSSDAYTPTTTQDDSQFQGFVTLYRTQRAVAPEMPLPERGSLVTAGWGEAFANHVVIARGLVPDKSLRIMWIQHMPAPVKFEDQEKYNFSEDGTQLVRVYVMPRSVYLAGYDTVYTAPPAVAALLTNPSLYGDLGYCYTGETVEKIGTDPDSLFVAVTRIWLQKVTTREFHDDNIDHDIVETREIIAKGTGSSSSSGGQTVEIQPGNRFIEYKITQTVSGFGIQAQLATLIRDVPFPFPRLLKSATWVGCAAFADSSAAAASYAESYYVDYDLKEPSAGPYEARDLRFLVTDPDSLRSTYPIQKVVTQIETIGQSRAWYIASPKGNSTFADARQLEVPSCIHGEIKIGNSQIGFAQGQWKDTLPPTPNFAAFSALTEMTIGYETVKVGYGLYIAVITQINTTGIYNGVTVPFGGSGGSTGAGDVSNTVVPPLTPTATMAADNSMITGKTSPMTEVRARVGNTEWGIAQSDTSGNYVMPLRTPYFTDAVEMLVTARRSGVPSLTRLVSTFDLAPLAPSATISTDLSTVSGQTEPGAAISILVNAAAQSETLTVVANRPQVETLTFVGNATADGDIEIQFTSALVSQLLTVGIIAGDTPNQQAEKSLIVAAASSVDVHWQFSQIGSSLIATARVTAANDGTAQVDLTDPNTTGVTPATSVNTTPGNDPVTVTTSGNAKLEVVSTDHSSPPLTVLFAVTAGDTPTQVSTKAAAALATSSVHDKYNSGSSTNSFSITANALRPNDNLLEMILSNGTCAGLIPSTSVQTTAGGIPFTTTANGAGAYSFPFSPVLSNGDTLTVTASDAGGTSPATTVTASTTPPTLASASFPDLDYDTITGSASNGSVVRAYVNDVQVGSAITSAGTYNITLANPLVRGELVRVVATDAGTPTIQSASIYINAHDLDLEKPSYQWSEYLGFYGKAPTGATHIKIRNPGGSLTDVPILSPSRNFSFTLPGQNGETYEIFARYAIGDSDPVYETVAVVDLEPPTIEIFDRTRNTVLTPEPVNKQRYRAPDTSRDGYLMYIAPSPGTTLAQTVLSFPGQSEASFTPVSNNYRAYAVGAPKPGGAGVVDATWRGPMMYQSNGPPGTTNAQLRTIFQAQLPILMEVTCTAADGRQAKRTFIREQYVEQFTGTDGIYG